MVSRILVPMDNSSMAERALEYAIEMYADPEITVLHVVGSATMMMGDAVSLALEDDIDAAAEARAEPVFERAQRLADEHGVDIDTAVGVGDPARAIVNRAQNYDAVVMGSHGKHSEDIARGFLIGNVAQKVFRRSPVAVTTVR
ncbi:universal stress protein [Halohasta litorea]|uniref:Universal stress protein n=1 Tax=Halohasta litorea TaxID=869891 RepID=A0ABD6D4V2_9EURY|nr:universal stress protein [Halohasta litorea]